VAKDPLKRVGKWDAKFKTDRVKAALDDMRPDMFARVQSTFPDIVAMEGQVKQVVDGLGVSMIQIPFYLSFGREIWSLQRNDVSGETLAIEADVLIQKWVARGLTQAVLEAIRTQVFNVVAPAP